MWRNCNRYLQTGHPFRIAYWFGLANVYYRIWWMSVILAGNKATSTEWITIYRTIGVMAAHQVLVAMMQVYKIHGQKISCTHSRNAMKVGSIVIHHRLFPRRGLHTSRQGTYLFSESISEFNIQLNNTRVLRLFHGLHEKIGLVCRVAIGAYVGARVYWHSTWHERTGQLAAGDVVPF